MNDVEQRIFDLVNSERRRARMALLDTDERLADIARGYSEDMGRRRFFGHVNPEGEGPQERVRRLYREMVGGPAENVAFLDGEPRARWAERFMFEWMNSPGHRANILRPTLTHLGVGIAVSGRRVYGTQLFADRVAVLLRPLPERMTAGETLVIEGTSPEPVSEVTINIVFPDPSVRFPLPGNRYTVGQAVLTPRQTARTRWEAELDMRYGKGRYEVRVGRNNRYYLPGYSIDVR